jgi:hypothetical protein
MLSGNTEITGFTDVNNIKIIKDHGRERRDTEQQRC